MTKEHFFPFTHISNIDSRTSAFLKEKLLYIVLLAFNRLRTYTMNMFLGSFINFLLLQNCLFIQSISNHDKIS